MYKGFRVIDAHCHIYPAKIAAKAVAGTRGFYGVDSPSLDGSPETLRSEGERAGIDRFAVCSVATTPHQVSAINRYIAGEAAKYGAWLSGIGTLHPASADPAADVAEALALGLCGVKLHPDIQGYALDCPGFLRLFELCEGRLPVLLHTGDRRYDYSNPERLKRILARFPRLTVVAAHFGTYTVWERAAELFGRENLWVDCSSSLPYLSRERAAQLVRGFGAERVLFGTDYPMWPPREALEEVFTLGLHADELELVLHRNAERVFSLPET